MAKATPPRSPENQMQKDCLRLSVRAVPRVLSRQARRTQLVTAAPTKTWRRPTRQATSVAAASAQTVLWKMGKVTAAIPR